MRNICIAFFLCAIPLLGYAQTADSLAIRQIDSLLEVVSTQIRSRNYNGALTILDDVQPLIIAKTGRESAQYAMCITRRAMLFIGKNDLKAAEKWLLEAQDIHVRVLSEQHPDYFRVLYLLGAFIYFRVNDDLCESNLLKAKIFLEKRGENRKIEYSRVLGALGNFYASTNQLDKASAIMQESLVSIEAIKGKENADYTLALENLSKIYTKQSRFSEAIARLNESSDIKVKTLGPKHPDFAITLVTLGSNYKEIGEFEKTEPLYEQALQIIEAAYGPKHPQYALVLESIAIFHATFTDDFDKAEQAMTAALKIYEEMPNGTTTVGYNNILKNLANLYLEMGEFKKAETLYRSVLEFLEKAGKDNGDYIMVQLNLALLNNKKGDYDTAEQLCKALMAQQESTESLEHNFYAQTGIILGTAYSAQGKYEQAEKVLQQAVESRGRILGKDHPLYAEVLSALAGTCIGLKQYERAEQLYIAALQIQEKTLGKQNLDYLSSIQGLAQTYSERNQWAQAAPHWLVYCQGIRHLVERSATYLSEQQMLAYLKIFEPGLNAFYQFVQQQPLPEFRSLAYDNTLFFNGLILENTRRLSAETQRADSLTRQTYDYWQDCRRFLAAQYAKPLAERKRIAELEEKAQNLEKDLARRLAAFGSVRLVPGRQAVQNALRPGEAAIEFIHYRPAASGSTQYAALVLLPGTDAPQWVPLFEEKQLAALLQTDAKPQAAFYHDLYAPDKKGSRLYDLIWKSAADKLFGATTIYFSPSGLLHRINLGAIPTPEGNILAGKHHLTMMGSTRQLAVSVPTSANSNNNAQLYGGIQYDAVPNVSLQTHSKSEDFSARRGFDFLQNDSTLRGGSWSYLRWTDVEIDAAADMMKNNGMTPILYKGANATEESFKTIGSGAPSPHVLHIATHGFFFPDPTRNNDPLSDAAGEKTFKVSEHPMIRSGLILAGANHAWKTGKTLRPDLEDGVLTAYEISRMNLSNTELVILSACETGLGDLVDNEGVYGLQRAFKIAGAHYLIMSLWQTPDFQTQLFMTAFYRYWLTDKMTIPDAFRATQAALRQKYGDAFLWAGFVLVAA